MSQLMSEPTDQFIKQLIDNYMNQNQEFNRDLEQINKCLNETNESIVIFSHQLDINSIINSDNQNLIQYLLENEKQFSETFEKRLIRKRLTKTQLNGRKVGFYLKYKNLPKNFQIKSFRELRSMKSTLISVQFLQMVSLSQPFESLIATKFVETNSQTNEESIKWKVRRIDETSEEFLQIKNKRYVESKSDRIYGQKRKVLAIIGRNERNNGLNPIEFTINYKLLTERELQYVYNGSHFDSVVLLRISSQELLLLSFQKICPIVANLSNGFKQFVSQFPYEIQELFEDRIESKYSFGLSLAYIFGDNLCISGSFFRFKLGLLLSLLSVNDCPKRNSSSVLVICNDTVMIRRLFEWSSLFSCYRFVQKSSLTPLCGVGRKATKSGPALEWIDSGALQLGADGVVVITSVCNLNELSEKSRTDLFHALETNEVIARQSQPSEPSLNESELKSTVWAVIEDNITERECLQRPERKTGFKNKTILWTEVFGMVYVIRESAVDPMTGQPNETYIYQQCDDCTLSFDVWQKTLDLMNQIVPEMTETAENVLQSYYVSNRRIRGSKFNRLSMKSLVSLANTFAKLSLRLNVSKFDALMAILLYEESLTNRLPQMVSPLRVEPVFHVKPHEIESAIGPNCDQYMETFEQKLNDFITQTKPKSTNSSNSFKTETILQNEE